ncbi:MAG: sigma-70 family RNA polymerase sigma factor, partial [Verrucomicrobiota bacterium]
MTDIPDAELLEQFARSESEEAFAELVRRHIALVHSVALRHTDNAQHAQEITQAVFIILARKASLLGSKTVLGGWLYHTARLTAANFRRAEFRRVRREQEAFMQSTLEETPSNNVWQELSPLLEEAMAHLGATDRDAVVLRFFENKSLAEVGMALGLEERAAQKRVNRALEKLRKIFGKRGMAHSAELIAGAISAHSVQAAPAALAKAVTAVAVAKGAAAGGSTLTLIKGALKIMAWTKMKMAIVSGAVVLLAAGTTTVAVKVIQERPMVVQGKTESEWIKSIVYFGDDKQTKLWRSLGPKGIQMLVRALKSPTNDHSTRMCAASLLDQLGNNAKSAIPEIINLLKTEKDDGVREIELGYFEGPIERMDEKEKAALFPELLRGLQSENSSVRNNSLVALQYYPNQSDIVIPLMVKALQDPIPGVRVMAIKALNKVDPQNAASSSFVAVLVGCLTDTQGAANDAVIMLGELHREPDLAVPALTQILQNSAASYLRNNSAAALGRFGGQAKPAVSALQKALEDS